MQEISPQLEKLQKEKKLLFKYKQNESQLHTMQKQIVAYDFNKNTTQKLAKKSEVDRLRNEGEDQVKKIDD